MKYSYRLIAKFNYNNMLYLIILVNKNKLIYAVYKDKKLSIKISRQDLYIFNLVYKSLKINTDKSISLGIKEIDGKSFDIFYDKESCLHYWYEVKFNKKYESDFKDNCKLNFKYNNIPTVYYNNVEETGKGDNEGKNRFINRIVKLGKKTLLVSVIAGLSFTTLAKCSVANKIDTNTTQYNIQNSDFELYSPEVINQRKYKFKDIKKAIKSNPNLTDSEKEFIYKFEFVFDENYKYMDLDLIIDRLSTLEIEYIKDLNNSIQIVGLYDINKNKIILYNTENFEKADLSHFTHEILHVFQPYAINRLSLELSNELTTREILRRMNEMELIENNKQFLNNLKKYSDYGNGYEPCMRVEYLLANILPKEVIQEYQFGCTDDILVNALLEIDGKKLNSEPNEQMEQRAYKLLDCIDDLKKTDENGNTDLDYSDEKYKKIYNQIDYYYKKKNGINMEETLKSDIFKYDFKYICVDYGTSEESIKAGEKTLLDEIPTEMYNIENKIIYDFYKYVLPKTYLSDVHPNPIVILGTPEAMEIEITDELDNKYKENYKMYKEELKQINKHEYEME